MTRLRQNDILWYSNKLVPRDTVRRHYREWRRSQGIPERCDEESCVFHSQPLVWNGKPLKLILEHKNGVNSDNRPENLRFLCPNCDSQLVETRGGANKGKVEKSEGGFVLVKKGGKRDHNVPVKTAKLRTTRYSPIVSIRPLKNS
jgi:hypothetical protein